MAVKQIAVGILEVQTLQGIPQHLGRSLRGRKQIRRIVRHNVPLRLHERLTARNVLQDAAVYPLRLTAAARLCAVDESHAILNTELPRCLHCRQLLV